MRRSTMFFFLAAALTSLAVAVESDAAPLTVFARADASALGNGQATVIHVMVGLPGSGLAAGADVRVSAGGGRFDAGAHTPDVGAFVTGTADASGRFTATWRCEGPCSQGYLLQAEAHMAGYEQGSFPLWIELTGGAQGIAIPGKGGLLQMPPNLLRPTPTPTKPVPGFIPIEPKGVK